MSQAGLNNPAAGPVPPTVATSYVTDSGTAIPAANVLDVNGLDSTENNVNGIITKADPNLSNNLQVVITNRLQGTAQTVDVGTADVITFTPTVIGTYSIEYRTSAFNTTSSLGAGYSFFGAIRFDGATSVLCDAFDEINNEEGAMVAVALDVIVSGADVILRAGGYAGQTINWSSVGLYTFIGA